MPHGRSTGIFGPSLDPVRAAISCYQTDPLLSGSRQWCAARSCRRQAPTGHVIIAAPGRVRAAGKADKGLSLSGVSSRPNEATSLRFLGFQLSKVSKARFNSPVSCFQLRFSSCLPFFTLLSFARGRLAIYPWHKPLAGTSDPLSRDIARTWRAAQRAIRLDANH